MSGINLVYKFDALNECSRKMGTTIFSVGLIRDNLNRMKDSLESSWRGDAYNAYSERFTSIIEKINQLHDELDKNHKKLDKVIEKQIGTEKEQFRKVDDLSADDIF